MFSYILKRLLVMIPTLLGITFITFMIIQFAPGDPVAASFGGGGGPSASSEGGDSEQRLDDAKKAKKKLLGMVVEDYIVRSWDAATASRTKAEEVILSSGATSFVPRELERVGGAGEFTQFAHALSMSKDGSRLFVGADDGSIYGVDRETGERLWVIEKIESEDAAIGVWAVAVSPDGTRLATADTNGAVNLLDATNGEVVAVGPVLGKIVRDLAFLPDGSGFISACDDGIARLHSSSDAQETAQFAKGHITRMECLALSPDGSRLYTGGADKALIEWDTATQKIVRQFPRHGQSITDIAISTDGTMLVTACADKTVRLFELREGDTAAPQPALLEAHAKEVTAVAISPDKATIFSGSKDESIRSWSMHPKGGPDNTPGWAAMTMTGTRVGEVHQLVVSPDGASLYSASESWRPVPVYRQYLTWLWRTVTLDFDRSFTDDRPVIEKILERLPITMELNFIALLVIYLISIPLGVASAVKRNTWFDNVSSVVVFVLYSIPNFWAATMLIMYFSSAKYFNWFPSGGLHDDEAADMSYLEWLGDAGLHLVLPIVASVYAGFASLSRYMRTSLLENISQDYVRTARAKGLSERVVIFKHALRNSLITIVTLVGNLLPAMIGGSLIIEYIFNIEGMGLLGFEAILSRDYPVIMAVTTFGAFLTLLGILVSDLLYGLVDPRITHG